jgi:hypothetical protein
MKTAVTAIFAFSIGVAITVGVAAGITGWVQAGEGPAAVMSVELERVWRLDVSGLEGDERTARLVCKKALRKKTQ